VTRSVGLGRNAQAVLAVFAKFHTQAGDTLRCHEIFHNLGDAQIARRGQRELIREGFVIERQYALELTLAGHTAIKSCSQSPAPILIDNSNNHAVGTIRSSKRGALLNEPPSPSTQYVLKRFALKLGMVLVFAFAQVRSPWGSLYAFVALAAFSSLICRRVSLHRSPQLRRKFPG